MKEGNIPRAARKGILRSFVRVRSVYYMGVWRLRILFAEMIESFEGFPKAKLLCTAEALQMDAASVRRPGAYCICEKR